MQIGKRILDLTASLSGLLLLSPLLAAIAAAIKLEDGGPVFFRQERAGHNFRPFLILKFRTMVLDAPSQGLAITVDGDPRVTKTGRFLRKAKLDELPQLINVLKGDMSIVGPRPEVWKYVNEYREEFEEVLKVKPGITDFASIMYRDEEDLLAKSDDPEAQYISDILPVKLGLNRQYLGEMSVAGDMKIILGTLFALYNTSPAKAWRASCAAAERLCVKVPGVYTFGAIFRRHRRPLVFVFHCLVVTASASLTMGLLYNGEVPEYAFNNQLLPYILLALAAKVPMFYIFGLHRGLWRYTSVTDLVRILAAVSTATALLYIIADMDAFGARVGGPAVIVDGMMTVALLSTFRFALRLYKEYQVAGFRAGKRVLIIGAGNAGEMIVRDMKKNPDLYEPIGFIDDNPTKKGLCIHGVPILGRLEDIKGITASRSPQEILIAIPSAKPATMQDITKRLSDCHLPIKTLPGLKELMSGSVTVGQIRPLELDDLLSRPPIRTDAASLHKAIAGRCVMVTGAGGSIGSEICRQVLSLGARAVVAFERHENSLYNLEMELRKHQSKSSILYPTVGDVNDTARVEEIIEEFKPDVIYHAAAHKHVPMMEINPREAIYNNILGTRNAALAAERLGVERFVLISTDKAVNPTSIMGASKRACEILVRALGQNSATRFITVRFGNVLGSSGSVVPLFREQIKRGGPVTITHPDIERYLMLIPEAVQLVIQAASIGKGGEIFVLDMGEPVKISDLARNLIVLSGFEPDKDIKIEYIGLRPGEKLFEELFDKTEDVSLTQARKVLMAISKSMPDRAEVMKHVAQMEQALSAKDADGMFEHLTRLVNTYTYTTPQINDAGLKKAA
ncbi:MAG TPA: SDR family NAD(P)-dependent oxidoreductase [Nitrospirota bacterium]